MKLNIILYLLSRLRPFAIGLSPGNLFRNEGAALISGRLSVVDGTENSVIIGESSRFVGRVLIRGSINKILIGKHCDFRGNIIIEGHGQTVSFGDHSSAVGVEILCQEGCNVSIGRWCMFSREIEILTTDRHSVIDRMSGKRTNLPGSVTIGDHVWGGLRTIISKGVNVGDDNIIAAGAFVNKVFKETGVIISGSPARIVKRDVTWDRSRRAKLSRPEMDAWRRKPND